VAIPDVDVPGSDGWWMNKAWTELKAKRKHYTLLENYRRGTPPISMGTAKVASAFYRFQQQCRTNVADLAVQALVERMGVRTIRTAASADDDGDVQATRLWSASGMSVAQSDVYRMLATYGEAFTSTSAPDTDDGWSRIVAEDPRECVVLHDNQGRAVAGFKLASDTLGGYDYAILWRPGRKVVAVKEGATGGPRERTDRMLRPPATAFSAASFTIRPERPDDAADDDPTTPIWSESYDQTDLPLVRHVAPEGVGVFERHLDLVDQINHIVLQGLVIATLQAFKQRAIESDQPLPTHTPDGKEIDWNDLFSADPGSLWLLLPGQKIWESGQVDLTGILQQAKDAIQRFASVTRTPFSMFSSDAVNQSAQGAQLTREGLVFKVESYQRAEDAALAVSLSIGFKFMPDAVRFAEVDGGRVDRADPTGIVIDWLPAERFSLAERSQADSQTTSLSVRGKLRRIWQLTPAEIDQVMNERREDALLEAIAKGPSSVGAGAAASA
jgi:hypothetical protein